MGLLARLGAELPVVAAPMAGGPSTPALVGAAARAGGLGFVAAGYRTVENLAESVGAAQAASDGRFGVNLFAPSPESTAVDPVAYARYRSALVPLAERFGVELPVEPREDDDAFAAKVDLLVADPVPVVSFTFGLPDAHQVRALRGAGTALLATVTTVDEARAARDAGLDALVVQARCAGGHSGTWYPSRPVADVPLVDLVAEVRSAVPMPIWGAGGVWRPEQTAALLAAGAEAVQVGTALLRTPEAGTSTTYRSGLAALVGSPRAADPGDDPGQTRAMTRAFSGRPAGAIRNEFVAAFDDLAPSGYPAVHHLTSPLRAAATAAGAWQWINLWGGPGHAETTEEPAGDVLRRIAGR